MNTQLTDLMNRATENLEPVTPDLLERSVAQGLRLRRRRTAIATASGAGAVLATAGLIAGGIHLAGSPRDAGVAGSPVPIAKPSAKATPTAKPAGVNPKQTLATLKALVAAPGRTFVSPETWGGGDYAGAAYVVNDGHGAARVDVLLSGGGEGNPCVPKRAGCSTLPDGSVLYVSKESPEYSDSRQAEFSVVSNYVVLFRRDGRNINLTSYNGPAEKGKQHTRPTPLLSVEDLSALAKSKAWKLPPVSPTKGMK
ncbi:hypothetical protein [Kribbella speibonae]|uniref:Uncharacterized protein n=1 Tax=Kribbella speibonae TaxID=1572660 RepID=A0ABY2ABA9_9ACTN|nr:hypothetical protein [Kribbella speibonae]TCC26796.1 hypothetical protein E0H58_01900 [Kribbella speibonae]